jgi:hypothetical protein
MSPGTYIMKRREAAGLSLDDVAARVGGDAAARADLRANLRRFEAGDPGEYSGLIYQQLPGVFPFDRRVLAALVIAASNPAKVLPPICRVCACSDFDPCVDRTGPCGWTPPVPGKQPLCTACPADEPDPSAQLPIPAAANEGEARHAA